MHNWYCIYTKPGQEDGVVKKLGELPGLYAFNPKLKRKKYSRAKLIDAVEALFPGYIFCQIQAVGILPHDHLYARCQAICRGFVRSALPG